jgi:hypothetical protein
MYRNHLCRLLHCVTISCVCAKDLGKAAGFEFDMSAPLSDTMDSHSEPCNPMDLPPNLILIVAGLYLWAFGQSEEKGEALAQAVSVQYFTKAQRLADHKMLCWCASEARLDPDAALEYLESDNGFTEVNASVQSLHQAGVHSIPVFLINAKLNGTAKPYEQVVHGSADTTRFAQVFKEITKWAETTLKE